MDENIIEIIQQTTSNYSKITIHSHLKYDVEMDEFDVKRVYNALEEEFDIIMPDLDDVYPVYVKDIINIVNELVEEE